MNYVLLICEIQDAQNRISKKKLRFLSPGFIQKFATIFQGLFKVLMQFSRTTYQEYNFTDCTKIHIISQLIVTRL